MVVLKRFALLLALAAPMVAIFLGINYHCPFKIVDINNLNVALKAHVQIIIYTDMVSGLCRRVVHVRINRN